MPPANVKISPPKLVVQETTSQERAIALIAGGASFIGVALAHALLAKNLRVICLDDFSTSPEENLRSLFKKPDFELVRHDLNEDLPLHKIDRPRYLFHLAGFTAAHDRRDFSLDTLLVNSRGTHNLLEFAKIISARFLLLSSFDLYLAAFSSRSLKHFSALDEIEEKNMSLREAKRFSENLTAEYFKNYHLNARIVRIGDPYGPGMNLNSATPLSRLLRDLLSGQSLKIPGEGLEILYPTYVTDLVNGLVQAMFIPETQGGIFTLVAPQEITLLQIAKLLQALAVAASPRFRNLPLEFIEGPKPQLSRHLRPADLDYTQEVLGLTLQVDLKTGLQKTLDWLLSEKPLPRPALPPAPFVPKKKEPPRPAELQKPLPQIPSPKTPSLESRLFGFFSFKLPLRFFTLVSAFILFLLFLLSPLLALAWPVFTGLSLARQAVVSAQNQDFPKATSQMKQAQTRFQNARATLFSFSWFYEFLLPASEVKSLASLLSFAHRTSAAAGHLFSAGQPGLLLLESVTSRSPSQVEPENLSRYLAFLKLETTAAFEELSFAQLELEDLQNSQSFFFTQTLARLDLKEGVFSLDRFSDYRGLLEQSRQLFEVLPRLLGLDNPKTYLLLFQNNTELRPTGGFIGSFGLLKFEKGVLADLDIFDVYEADGQLKGRVEPPPALALFLNQPNWYLRDSNWSPDFPLAAAQAEWFLEKELGLAVDGVLALDLTAIEFLLSETGPVHLPQFNVLIGPDNLFTEAEKRAEVDFFPGSSQKKDFLGSLAEVLLQKLFDSQSLNDWPKIAKALDRALNEKHFLLFFHDPLLQNLVSQHGWDGSLNRQTLSLEERTNRDFVAFIEANLGGNKANRFLSRQISQEVTLDKEKNVHHRLSLTFQNNSPADTWPAGPYKNYLRFYLPLGSRLTSARLNGKTPLLATELTENNLQSLGDDQFLIVQTEEIIPPSVSSKPSSPAHFSVFAVYLEVPVRAKTTLTLEYRSSFKPKTLNYQLFVWKQPGLTSFPYFLTLNYPSFLTPRSSRPPFQLELPQRLMYNENLSQDREFFVEFAK